MDINLLMPLLQVADSAYPTGGFSHSLGLEAFVQHHGIRTTARDHQLLGRAFVSILENSGSFGLPFVRAAHFAVAVGQTMECGKMKNHTLVELDKMCEACTTNHIARRASTKQGKSLLEVSCFTYCELFNKLETSVLELPHSHFPVVFGAVLAGLGLDEDTALASFLYCVVRSVIATAVRLDVLGCMEGQKLQRSLQELVPGLIDRNRSRTPAEACMKFPVVDILQNTQDTMFSKLFYS